MQAIEHELEVTVRVHEVRAEYERQMEEWVFILFYFFIIIFKLIYFHLEMFELSRTNKFEEDQFFYLSCFLRCGCGDRIVSFSLNLWLD